jgi:hypothetical protein
MSFDHEHGDTATAEQASLIFAEMAPEIGAKVVAESLIHDVLGAQTSEFAAVLLVPEISPEPYPLAEAAPAIVDPSEQPLSEEELARGMTLQAIAKRYGITLENMEQRRSKLIGLQKLQAAKPVTKYDPVSRRVLDHYFGNDLKELSESARSLQQAMREMQEMRKPK